MARRVAAAVFIALILTTGSLNATFSAPAVAAYVVSVNASVGTEVVYGVVDASHLDIISNTGWILTAETDRGVVTLEGGRTGNTPIIVLLPVGTTSYSITSDR